MGGPLKCGWNLMRLQSCQQFTVKEDELILATFSSALNSSYFSGYCGGSLMINSFLAPPQWNEIQYRKLHFLQLFFSSNNFGHFSGEFNSFSSRLKKSSTPFYWIFLEVQFFSWFLQYLIQQHFAHFIQN